MRTKPAALGLVVFLSLFFAGAGGAQTSAPTATQPIDPATAPLSPNAPVQSAPLPMPPSGLPGAPGMPGAPGGSIADGGDDIRDIRTVVLEPPINWTLWISLGVVALLFLVALVVYLIMRGRKPPLLPHEKALLGLEEARSEAKPGEGREYAYTVSEIVRQYIEQRFEVSATQNTTEEFLAELLNDPSGSLAEYRTELEEFMGGCDLVKFAAMELDQEGIDQFHGTALGFVRATAPKKEGQEVAAPAASATTVASSEPPTIEAPPVEVPQEESPVESPLNESSPPEPAPAVAAAPSFVQEPEPVTPTGGSLVKKEEPQETVEAASTAEPEEHPDSKYLPK